LKRIRKKTHSVPRTIEVIMTITEETTKMEIKESREITKEIKETPVTTKE